MIAVGAYVGPAVALIVAGNGRKTAAFVFWSLAVLAMVTNSSQTLGAVASRGAGTEAERAKAAAAVKNDRAHLARIERERAGMKFTATDAAAVKAAIAAVVAAERIRAAECEKRGPNCRLRETEERDALTTAQTAKALTDQVAKLARSSCSHVCHERVGTTRP
jgi:hypothetical protein